MYDYFFLSYIKWGAQLSLSNFIAFIRFNALNAIIIALWRVNFVVILCIIWLFSFVLICAQRFKQKRGFVWVSLFYNLHRLHLHTGHSKSDLLGLAAFLELTATLKHWSWITCSCYFTTRSVYGKSSGFYHCHLGKCLSTYVDLISLLFRFPGELIRREYRLTNQLLDQSK